MTEESPMIPRDQTRVALASSGSRKESSRNLVQRVVLAGAVAEGLGCPRIATRPAELQPLVEIQIHSTPATIDDYATWSPMVARIRITNPRVVRDSLLVVLQNMDTTRGGQIRFAPYQSPWPPNTIATLPSLSVALPPDGRPRGLRFGLDRVPTGKRIDLREPMQDFARTTGEGIQQVFEQGQAIGVPHFEGPRDAARSGR